MGAQYGPYVMYFLSQLLQKQQAMAGAEQKEKNEYFSMDETAASWHRQEDVERVKRRRKSTATLLSERAREVIS